MKEKTIDRLIALGCLVVVALVLVGAWEIAGWLIRHPGYIGHGFVAMLVLMALSALLRGIASIFFDA